MEHKLKMFVLIAASSRYQLLLLLLFFCLLQVATGRYRWIQAVASAFPLLPAGCHYMQIAV